MTLDFTKFNEVLLIVPNNLKNKILDYFNHYDNFVNYKMIGIIYIFHMMLGLYYI